MKVKKQAGFGDANHSAAGLRFEVNEYLAGNPGWSRPQEVDYRARLA